ncbi:MAG: hypothetical protein ACTSO3_16680 [Candidatus Heimdallarchaeaceae archaeon]
MTTKIYVDIRLRIDSEDDFEKFQALKGYFGDRFDTEVLRKAIREAYNSIFPETNFQNIKRSDEAVPVKN